MRCKCQCGSYTRTRGVCVHKTAPSSTGGAHTEFTLVWEARCTVDDGTGQAHLFVDGSLVSDLLCLSSRDVQQVDVPVTCAGLTLLR